MLIWLELKSSPGGPPLLPSPFPFPLPENVRGGARGGFLTRAKIAYPLKVGHIAFLTYLCGNSLPRVTLLTLTHSYLVLPLLTTPI